jgi:hypothetical protein
VPTWNYSVVHAYGHPEMIEDKHWLRSHVTDSLLSRKTAEPHRGPSPMRRRTLLRACCAASLVFGSPLSELKASGKGAKTVKRKIAKASQEASWREERATTFRWPSSSQVISRDRIEGPSYKDLSPALPAQQRIFPLGRSRATSPPPSRGSRSNRKPRNVSQNTDPTGTWTV